MGDMLPKGTEKSVVKRMIAAKQPKHGKVAAEFMADLAVDLLGIQEMQSRNGENVAKYMNMRRCKHVAHANQDYYGVYQPTDRNHDTAIIHSQRLGVVHPLPKLTRTQTDPNTCLRSVSGIYVPLLELVFLNVWMDHDGSKVKPLESLDSHLREALGDRHVARVIMVGDFNDPSGTLVGKSIKLLGHELTMYGEPCHTCADDADYSYVGDFIFDSVQYSPTLGFGVPRLPHGWTARSQL